jgi:hypothetical protein
MVGAALGVSTGALGGNTGSDGGVGAGAGVEPGGDTEAGGAEFELVLDPPPQAARAAPITETRIATRNFLSMFFSSVDALPGERSGWIADERELTTASCHGCRPATPLSADPGSTDRRLCVPALRRVCH